MKTLFPSSSNVVVRCSSKNSCDWFHPMLRFLIISYLAFFVFVFLPGCAPPFSALQSAKLVGKGKIEVTPSFSAVYFSNEGSMEHVQNDYGLQGAYGLGDRFDVRLRFEFINVHLGEEVSFNANVLGLGPKIGIMKDGIALCLPVGFAFGGDIEDISETWQFHPTFLFTLPIGNNFEFNPSTKALVPLSGDGDVLIAFNLGAGISTNLEKWAIRPEAGFLVNPGEEGHFTHFSIGITLYP